LTARIFSKLLLSLLAVLAFALVAVDYLVTERVEHAFSDQLRQELAQKARTIALMLPQQRGQNGFAQLAQATAARITWVDAGGRVLGDSDSDPAGMDNHRLRPEIVDALKGQVGSSLRLSPTLGVRMFYLAIPYQGGALRLAVPAAAIDAQVRAIRQEVLLSTALAFLPLGILAAVFARYISGRLGSIIEFTRQLAEGNFRARLSGSSRGELGLLSTKLNETSEKLEFMLDRLETEHAELEKLENVRKDFVINVSHELRTPLASIQGYTETLLEGALHDPANNLKFLNIIRQNAERLARLTADLLTLSRVELGQQEFKYASYYVSRLLNDDLDGMRPIAERRRVQLVLEPVQPEGAEVFCDAEAVHQILTNLLDNAIKYTPEGGIVTVGARKLGAPGDAPGEPASRVEFFVRDTGSGIPAADLPRLFERFYRVDKARSRALGGTGLGLAIVKHLARSQNGEVRVESQVDKGSTFFVTLPVQDLGTSSGGTHPKLVQRELTT
jgi:two-component system, OmpR family, phosphate regulon sensor histidine kinase PhoR